MVLRKEFHHNIYIFALILLAVSLPLSIWLTSLAQIILSLNWLIEGKLKKKIQGLKNNVSIPLIISLYFLHVAGLLFTTDFSYALHDLKIKLPILLLPIIIGTSEPLSSKNFRTILLAFTGACLIGTLVSMTVFLGIYPGGYNDIREISLFISHMRFSLMIVFSIFILLYFIFSNREGFTFSREWKIIFGITDLWLMAFLFILKTLTGLVIFGSILFFLALKYSGSIKNAAYRLIVRFIILAFPLVIFAFLNRSVERFFLTEEVNFASLDSHTPYGNPYFHDTLVAEVENGNFVWIYISDDELRKSWNIISDYKYDGKDKRGQDIRFTLIRYLSSKGLRKDQNGIKQLKKEDISAIENGLTNYIFLDRLSLYPRIYEIIWEIDRYRKGYNPGGHSVAQRLLYLKAAVFIIGEHPFFGTGTGDVQKEFNKYYKEKQSRLEERWRRRAHNQYITFLLTFGIFGFLISMASLIIPPFREKSWNSYFFVIFFIISFISMLNEDTLETHSGVSFFMFFYCLLVFGRNGASDSHEGCHRFTD